MTTPRQMRNFTAAPGLAPRFTLETDAGSVHEIGRLATGGVRRQRLFTGGTFAGADVQGDLVGGSETLLDRQDGVTIVEANYLVASPAVTSLG